MAMSILGKKWFTCEQENAVTGSATIRGGIVDGSSYCLLLNDEVCSNTTKPWSSYDSTYDPKSQRLLSQECRYCILITSDYRCTKRLFFLLCGEVPRHSVSHSATSKPVLQASTPKQKFHRFFTISSVVHHEYALHL